ncbi:MAG TPA: HD domain-containing phosphohydrolase [Terracidiphilus sp.]|jgi:HD-GYP domain-containing protein (c-di-GMP phosphodiesterase class II)|nr:HD domain-containing phosphohydrolase [Terracidiphilus sp.]
MTSRFQTRAFLLCFLPFTALLTSSFWMVQRFAQSTVRDGLRASLRQNQLAMARLYAQGSLQNSRFLKVAGENTGLKAVMVLLLSRPESESAHRTVEDQLSELGQRMGFDFMLVSAPDGAPLAGVFRHDAGQLIPQDLHKLPGNASGLLDLDGHILQVASVPMDEAGEYLGVLSVGERFDLAGLTTLAALTRDGKVVESNLPGFSASDLNRALAGCAAQEECNLRLGGADWISLRVKSFGHGYQLLSFQNVDATMRPIQSRLNTLFLSLVLASTLVAMLCGIGSSRSIVEPIAAVVLQLRGAVRTGKLSELTTHPSSIAEIRELVEIYNRAAVSVRASGESLERAVLEFVGSLAHALDARDQYTAGHSWRVSQLSCGIAAALGLDNEQIERIRIGALLHDIGKIGIADHVLQKPGKLSAEEFALVKEHPVIGRHILEGVQGFAPFLAAVELHHENWDGTGYPRGQRELETPIDARIIHVSDAYDAMTTNRSYRRGMTHERAISILVECSGTQFDPHIVEIAINLPLGTFLRSEELALPTSRPEPETELILD